MTYDWMESMTKTCKTCGEQKPYDREAKRSSKASGFHGAKCWECYKAVKIAECQKVRATPEGLLKTRASSAKSTLKRRQTNKYYLLRNALAIQTNQLLTRISNGGAPKDTTCFKLFGASLVEVLIHFNRRLGAKGLSWTDYKTRWTCDHIRPVALAQSDVELRQMFKLANCQVLTIEEHAIKTLEDNARVRELEV